jgi:hypothetical protein
MRDVELAMLPAHQVSPRVSPGAPGLYERDHCHRQGVQSRIDRYGSRDYRPGKRLMSETFAVIEVFTLAGLLYLIVNFAVLLVMRSWLEPRLSLHRNVARPSSWLRLRRRRA